MKTVYIILLGLTSLLAAEEFITVETFLVTVGSTNKVASCDIRISYSGTAVDWTASSVDCSCKWPRSKALNYDTTLAITFGDLNEGIITTTVNINLKKGKNKAPGTLKTTIISTEEDLVTADPEFFPTTLWCPHNDYYVWGEGAYDSIVDEAPAEDYVQCAQRCAEYKNEFGNAPCFSWVINHNTVDVHGLGAGNCRLLAYMNVSGVYSPGVQSGYHKCWPAMQNQTLSRVY